MILLKLEYNINESAQWALLKWDKTGNFCGENFVRESEVWKEIENVERLSLQPLRQVAPRTVPRVREENSDVFKLKRDS